MAIILNDILPAMIGPGEIIINSTITDAIATYVTTIDGGKLTTGVIKQGGYDAGDTTKNSAWNLDTGEFVTHNANGSFIIDSTAAGDVNNPNIKGGWIKGAIIEGSVIKGSWIDYSSSGDLTNWKQYGPGLLPPSDENFARDSETNELIVTDIGVGPGSLGYYRLPGTYTIYSVLGTATLSIYDPVWNPNGVPTWDPSPSVFAYDSYAQDNVDRVITENPHVTVDEDVDLIRSLDPITSGDTVGGIFKITICGVLVEVTFYGYPDYDGTYLSVINRKVVVGGTVYLNQFGYSGPGSSIKAYTLNIGGLSIYIRLGTTELDVVIKLKANVYELPAWNGGLFQLYELEPVAGSKASAAAISPVLRFNV